MDEPFLTGYSSGLLFIAAKQAAKRAHQMIGRLGEQTEAMSAVVLSGLVAESSINEIGEWFDVHHLPPPLCSPHGLPYGFDQMELRVKWSLLPVITSRRTFDRGAEPWQSFHVLVELRNAIVHLRRRPLPKGAASLLRSKKLLGPHMPLGFRVARWACETMADMFEELTALVGPPEDWIQGGIWSWTPRYYPHGLSTPGDPFLDQ
jgi:hypothetical protein